MKNKKEETTKKKIQDFFYYLNIEIKDPAENVCVCVRVFSWR